MIEVEVSINVTLQQMYDNLPFKEPNEKFEDSLYKEFILKSINWIEKASCGVAFAQNYGSNWEAAYVLEYLLDVIKIARKKNDTECVSKSKTMCYNIVVFLLSHQDEISGKQRESFNQSTSKWVEQNERTNWDGNTWDTSVVCNALLYYIDITTDKKKLNSDVHLQKLWIALPNALRWLYDQFDNNRTQYSQYAFGSVDYSRILMFFIYVLKSKYCSKLLQKAKLTKGAIIKAIHNLARYIDKEKISNDVNIYNESEGKFKEETVINWGDCFITAEICDAVSHYLNFLVINKLSENHDMWIKNIYKTLKKAVRSIEATQSPEGMWGAHDDTIRCLSSYLITISELKIFEKTYRNLDDAIKSTVPKWVKESDCEEHKVFKAIRWLFDPKQRFSDGSYLHTSFLSVFMFEAFISINNHWSFSKNKTIYKIYDEVFWMSPTRTTQEKGQVIELEIDQENKLGKIKKLKRMTRLMGLTYVVLSVITIFFILSSKVFELLHINIKLNDEISDVGEMLSLTFAVIVFVITTIYLSKREEN